MFVPTAYAIQPYVEVGGVRFGMTPSEVEAAIGAATRITTNSLGERDEVRRGLSVRYDKRLGRVAEIAIHKSEQAIYRGIDLFRASDPLRILAQDDPNPLESLGFVVFLVSTCINRFPDNDQSQSNNVFSTGRWMQFGPA
jgi:hypothetical protein